VRDRSSAMGNAQGHVRGGIQDIRAERSKNTRGDQAAGNTDAGCFSRLARAQEARNGRRSVESDASICQPVTERQTHTPDVRDRPNAARRGHAWQSRESATFRWSRWMGDCVGDGTLPERRPSPGRRFRGERRTCPECFWALPNPGETSSRRRVRHSIKDCAALRIELVQCEYCGNKRSIKAASSGAVFEPGSATATRRDRRQGVRNRRGCVFWRVSAEFRTRVHLQCGMHLPMHIRRLAQPTPHGRGATVG